MGKQDIEGGQAVLEAHQLTVNYGRTPVLWDISLAVPPGKLVGIIGPNGAGKTTFLRTALGLIPPSTGQVEFWGQPLSRCRGRLAYVPQRETVDWDFPITVLELVLMGSYGRLGLFRWPKQAERDAAQACLKQVGMEAFADRQISQLSGGQQQRAFIARALLQDADVYFMDEPFAAIDIATERIIVELLQKVRDQGKTIFVVHHDLNSVESYFDWVMILNMRLVACGPVESCFTPASLNEAYGANYALLDEALRLSTDHRHGIV
jgi:manganese/zinc/iron transport system ATP- binding protein